MLSHERVWAAIDALCAQVSAELPSVDFVVNNAGRSIRRARACRLMPSNMASRAT